MSTLPVAWGAQAASAVPVTLVPISGGSLTVGIDQAPFGCNPNASTANSASRLVLGTVLPGAFETGVNDQVIGNQNVVAQAELVNTNPQTVVYTIDQKAVWSDGVPITADDFRYAWEHQRGTDTVTGAHVDVDASILGYRDIKSVTASDSGKTVSVVFDKPYADWRMLFDQLVPAHVMEKVGWDPRCPSLDPAVDLSGGPYVIQSVRPGRILLRVNPRWWGPPPELEAVTVVFATGPDQLGRWLRSGLAQVVIPQTLDLFVVQELAGNPRANSELDLSNSFVQLEFSVNGPVTSTVDQREAIAHAIDRQSLVASVTGGIDANVVPAQSHLYAQGQSSYPTLPQSAGAANAFIASNTTTATTAQSAPGSPVPFPTTADLNTTARLLVSAGYSMTPDGRWLLPSGAPLALRLSVDEADPWAAQSADVVSAQLRRAGLGVALVPEPTAAMAGAALASGQADLAVIPFEAGPFPTRATAWYTPELGPAGTNGSQDWSSLDDPVLESLLTQAAASFNPVEAQPIYARADQQLWTDMVSLPLLTEPTALGWSVRTAGVAPEAHGVAGLAALPNWQLREPRRSASPTETKSGTR